MHIWPYCDIGLVLNVHVLTIKILNEEKMKYTIKDFFKLMSSVNSNLYLFIKFLYIEVKIFRYLPCELVARERR